MKKIYMFAFLIVLFGVFGFSIKYNYDNKVLLDIKNDDLEARMETAFPYKEKIREFYGTVNLILSPNEMIVSDDVVVVKDEKGFLKPINKVSFNIEDTVEKIAELKDVCEETGAAFAYVSYPSKTDSMNVKESFGVDSNEEEIRSVFLNSLNLNGISVLNIREAMENEGYTIEDIFYKTDHHWNTKAGLLAARKIASYIKDNLGFSAKVELLDENQFMYTRLENRWLGETGRLFSKTWIGSLDDFTVIKPKYDTSLVYYGETGDFSMLMNEELQNQEIDLYTTSMHYTYLYGGGVSVNIHNNNNETGPRVLLIKDSFSNVVTPFLALACKDVTWWDMRGNDYSVYKFIRENKYDVVLVAYTDFWRSDMYQFN